MKRWLLELMAVQDWISAVVWFWKEVFLPMWWLWIFLFVWSCYRHYEMICKEDEK